MQTVWQISAALSILWIWMLGCKILDCDRVACSMPYSENAHSRTFVGLLLNIKNDAVSTRALSIQKMAERLSHLVGFSNERAARRHFFQRLNGSKKIP
ncbi:MAG: hypothetical protein JWL77_5712 [Chthonomonadaceae bacterium]|nr:hypothetical protein [Chthonomonadaceae bacterium]